jgi:hypothetical protein
MRLSPRRWLAFALSAALVLGFGSFALSKGSHTSTILAPITVHAKPITVFEPRDSSKTRFGALEFIGGLVLTSSDDAFGGISALHLEPDGSHLLALSDVGSWLRGRIVYDGGKPAGIADAEMGPILARDGKPFALRRRFDSESLTERGGMFYVGIEREQKIFRFDIRHHGLLARGRPIPVPPDFKTLEKNSSLECMAAAPRGSALSGNLIVVSEHSLDANGNHRSFLLNGNKFERFAVRRTGDFDVSDCTISPSGDLLLLERSFSLLRGLDMRIRRIPLASIKPGALVDGATLIKANLAEEIDNMEGIAAYRDARGETIITLISDDNFSPIQRTLLLQFKLVGE